MQFILRVYHTLANLQPKEDKFCYNNSMPKKISFSIVFSLCFFIALFFIVPISWSDELDDLTKQITDLTNALNQSVAATRPLESQLTSMQKQVTDIKNRVALTEQDIALKKKEIEKGFADLTRKEELLGKTIRSFYINSYYNSPLLTLLSAKNASEITQVLAYQQAKTNQDKALITNLALSITDLEKKKEALKSEQERLIVVKASLDQQSAKLDGIIKGAKSYQTTLSSQIASLSARQQEIINARSGGFTATLGDSDLADDYNASIKGFRESAPGGYFGVFSFGAYTHRNGMSQYGALGHVKNQGWGYEQLLKHYYPGISISDVDTNKTILVNGTNSYGQTFNNESFNFEDYLKHIYEVPSTWPGEILKAQAIAARSYAYNKGSICPGQGCQEFKREENSDAWKAAVEATKGKVMTGGPGNWQYSSTTGGWINGLGWDTTDGQGGSNFVDKSYEKVAGSPWVYKAWYTQTYRNNSDKCGRANPWLSPEEMADIVNAAIALKSGDIDTGRITPVTTSCWGGNPYTMDELKNLVSGKGGISQATSISVTQGNGTTNNITINGVSLDGAEFKKAFNLRAPGRLSIPQSGFAFFNIERK